MKNVFGISGTILFVLSLILIHSCTIEETSPPAITTAVISDISLTTATSGGNVISDGGGTVITRGVCWGTTANPTIADSKTTDGTGIGIFTSSITGLTAGTTYYVRGYASNGSVTAYGNEAVFITLKTNQITDIQGNVYNTIIIGTQMWLAENLKTTKFNDGTNIPRVREDAGWATLSTPGYCWYDNDSATYKPAYGAFYNWYAVNTGKLCPTGWHVSSDAEWTTLTTYLGGQNIAGGKLKETGTTHWLSPNTGATNESGFTSIPAGIRGFGGIFGSFSSIGMFAAYWTSTADSPGSAYYRDIGADGIGVYRREGSIYINFVRSGLSVRCIKTN